MRRWINQKSFQKDGYKLVTCRNCLSVIGKTYIGEKNERTVTCECKSEQKITPPRLWIKNGKRGAFWCDESESCSTAFDD